MAVEVATLLVRVRGDIADAQAKLAQIERSLSQTESSLQRAAATATGFIAAFAGMALASRAVDAAHEAVLGFNASLEQSEIAWTTMLHSAQTAGEFLFQLKQFAAQTPFEFQDVERGARRLLAMGFTAREVLPLLTDIGNAASGLGLGSEGVNRLTLALGQMQAKGRVLGQELLQLTEAGVNLNAIFAIMAEQTGRSVQELRKAQEEGKLTSDVFIAAFQEFSRRNFGGMMERQAMTFRGALSTIHDSLLFVSSTAFKPLFDRISELARRIALFVQTDEFQRWGGRVAAVVTVVLDHLSVLAQGFGAVFASIARIVQTIGSIILDALQLLNPFARHSPSLVESVEAGVDRIIAKFAELEAIRGPLERAGEAIRELGDAAAEGIGRLQAILEEGRDQTLRVLSEDLPDAFRAAQQAIETLVAESEIFARQIQAQNAVVEEAKRAVDEATRAIRDKERAIRQLEDASRQYDRAADAVSARISTLREFADRARDAVGALRDQLSAARDRLRELAGTPVAGTRAFQERLEAINDQIARVQLQLTRMRLSGAPKDQIKRLEDQLEHLRLRAEEVRLEEAIQLDPLRRKIKQMVDTQRELPFEKIAAGIREQQRTISGLEQSLARATEAWTKQQEALKREEHNLVIIRALRDEIRQKIDAERQSLEQLRQARDAAQERLQAEQEALAGLRDAYSQLQKQIEQYRDALKDVVRQAEEQLRINEAGAREAERLAKELERAAKEAEKAAKKAKEEIPVPPVRDVLEGLDLTEARAGLEAWREEFEETVRKIRAETTPAIEGFRDRLHDVSRELDKFRSALQAAHSPLVQVTAGVIAFGAALLFLSSLVRVLATIGSVAATVGATITGTLGAPVTLVLLGLAAAATALYMAWNSNFAGLRDTTNRVFGQDVPRILASARQRFEEFRTGAGRALSGIESDSASTFDRIRQTVETFGMALRPLWTGITDFFVRQWAFVTEWYEQNLPRLRTIAGAVFNAILALAQDHFGLLGDIFGRGGNVLQTATMTVLDAIEQFWSAHGTKVESIAASGLSLVGTAVETGLRTVLLTVQAALQLLTGDWEGAWTTLKNIVELWLNAVIATGRTLLDTLVTLFGDEFARILESVQNTWQSILATTGNVWNDIVARVRNAVNDIIDAINGLIRGWNSLEFRLPGGSFKVPEIPLPGGGSIGGQEFRWGGVEISPPKIPEIPRLATGGIVTRPTLAVLGEEGPEAVLPLSRTGVPVEVNVVVEGSVIAEQDLAQTIRSELLRLGRRTGAVGLA